MMGSMQRRGVLAVLLSCAAAFAVPAHADEPWPSRPIRLVLPFSAGGPGDVTTRLIGGALTKQLGQPIVVDNRPGAGGMTGSGIVARSAPDGYTLLIAGNGAISNALLHPSMPYADADLIPVVATNSAPSVIVTGAATPVHDLRELQVWAKAKKGLNFGDAGVGSTGHFVAEMLGSALGVPVTVVHYKSGSETINAILGGQIDLASEAPVAVLSFVRSGKLRALAVADSKRLALLPDVRSTAEQGFATVQMQAWGGIYAPKGTPAAILDRIAQATQRAFDTDTALRAQFEAFGYRTIGGTRADFERFIADEKRRLGKLVADAHMSAD
jgi:tripartite-type tricarboxylate transporter receptor subunit TctC